MTKKIAIVVCAWPPGGGGIGNTAYYHAKALNNEKYQITAFIPKYHDTIELLNQQYKLKYLPMFWEFGKAGFMKGLWREMKQFDLIHLYYPFFGTDWIVYFFKFFHPKIKVVLHYQMDPIGSGFKKILFRWYVRLFLNWHLSWSEAIIALSEDHANNSYFTSYYLKHKEKFFIVPNMVDTDKFKPAEKDLLLLKELGFEDNDKIVMFAGGLDSHHHFKGVDLIIKAVADLQKKHPDIKLLIVGDGNWREKYANIAKDLGVDKRTVFTGWIANEDLPRYYNLAEIFVLPSTDSTEAFGGVLAEAQCCGVAGIVSNWPGSRMTLENGVSGLWVNPGDQKDLTEKIDILLSDNELRNQMGEAATKRAHFLYGADEAVNTKIVSMYDEIFKK